MASRSAFALAALSLVGTAAGAACPGKTNVAELVKLAPTCLETCAVACEPFDQLLAAVSAGKTDELYLTGIACKYTTGLLCVAKTENAQACAPIINGAKGYGLPLPTTEAGAKAGCDAMLAATTTAPATTAKPSEMPAASTTVPAASVAAAAVIAAVASASLS
mmetsp:Transcript_115218/g.322061  ORF Transcript_115218/g.322061 Transcript_115218/m.322061 type:complete len:163 (+) Transcript_115218:110-598(+)